MSKQSLIKLVEKNLGKVVTMQDMSNVINKKKPRKDDSDLDRNIEYLKQKHEADSGSELQIVYKDDSSHKIVKIIFYMSSSMKDLIDQCGSVLHIDGTYCLSKDRYIMYPFVVSDQFNVSRICAWALCSDEKSDTLQGVLQLFKDAIGDGLSSKIEYLILDKDFGELRSATSILPGAKFVLCKYHVLTYVKDYVRKICLPSNLQQIKDTMFQYFSQMLYADTEDVYFDSWRSLCSLSNHHENIKLAISYFDRNWHANREMWSFHIIKTYKIQKNHTNNRIEGKNKQLKGEIGRSKSLLFISQKMFDIAQNECNDMMIRKVNAKNKTFWPSTIGSREEEEIMKEGSKYLGKEVLQKVLIELRNIASFDDELDYSTGQTKCPRKRGVCYSNASDVIPCKHLFEVRLYNSEKLIEKSMFGKFWMLHTTENAALEKKVSKSSIFKNFSKLTSQNSKPKHKDLKKVINPLIEDISCKSLEEQQEYLMQLEQLQEGWRNEKKVEIRTSLDVSKIDKEQISEKSFALATSTSKPNSSKRPLALTDSNVKSRKISKYSHRAIVDLINATYKPLGLVAPWDDKTYNILKNRSSRSGMDRWINDVIVSTASLLVQTKNPTIGGLENPLNYLTTGFKAVPAGKMFIQVMHNGSDHWITATKNCIAGEADVIAFNSMMKFQKGSQNIISVSKDIEIQICQLLRHQLIEENKFSVKVIFMPCMQQQNASDCGIYAIANMMMLALGKKSG